MAGAATQPSTDRPGAAVRFLASEAAGSVLLLICTIAALVWANSRWSGAYFQILETEIGLTWNDSRFALSVGYWINDGLMALFFFVVGLEIKREILVGELSSLRKAILPVAAAAGGMIVPALIFSGLNRAGEAARGWGIPMATDIAFAIGILALLGPRVPPGLKLFLAVLAIADDLGAVLVIAFYYTDHLSALPLIAAFALLGLLFLAARMKVKLVSIYAVLAIGVWLGVLASGIHATVAGILLAMVVPVRSRIQARRFFTVAREQLATLEASEFSGETSTLKTKQMEALEALHQVTSDVVPAGPAFERYLHPITAFVILPLFALFNAGVVIDAKVVDALVNPVGLGVVLGLVIGKQVGVTVASWLVVRLRLAALPAGVTWAQIYGSAILAGIGFTMALFVSDLAIDDEKLLGFSKVGILAGSTICAAAGYGVLRAALKGTRQPPA